MIKENISLKSLGLKSTPARGAVLELFSKKCNPLCAEDIYKKFSSKSDIKIKSSTKAKIDLVTIYRTLSSFEAAGILKRVDLHKESTYYELADHHHHHIVCTDCGTVESFDNCAIGNLSKDILKKSSKFNKISQHSLEFFGVCKTCAKG